MRTNVAVMRINVAFLFLMVLATASVDTYEQSATSDLHRRGLAAASAGDYKAAVAALSRALEVEPNSALIQNDLGYVHHLFGNYREAIKAYQNAVNSDRNYALAWNNLGVAYRAAGDYPSAVKSLDRAIQLRSDYAEAFYNLGVAYQWNGSFADAVLCFTGALNIDPRMVNAHHGLGVTYIELERYDEAVESLSKAVGLRPNAPLIHKSLGFALHKMGDLKGAVRAYGKAVSERPDAQILNNLGVALDQLGRHREACEHYQLALNLESGYIEPQYNLGIAFLALQERDKAFRQYVTLKKARPELAEKLLMLMRADRVLAVNQRSYMISHK
jgi:tetratricopeptide (TPR) repeat protein